MDISFGECFSSLWMIHHFRDVHQSSTDFPESGEGQLLSSDLAVSTTAGRRRFIRSCANAAPQLQGSNAPMRKMIAHYHTQHRSSFSAPLPILFSQNKAGMSGFWTYIARPIFLLSWSVPQGLNKSSSNISLCPAKTFLVDCHSLSV